jgi:DNA-directed RNA polymerase specialized sigma24 family protein
LIGGSVGLTFCSLWDYIFFRGEAIVWIDPDDPENYPDPEVDTLVESKLGAPPQTYIVLHISRNPGSEQLALELAIEFAKRWPSVLDNLSGLARRIFTVEEMQALYESGLGVWEDENKVPLPKEWYATDEEYLALWQREELEKQDPELTEEENTPAPIKDDTEMVTEADYVQSVLAEMDPVYLYVLLSRAEGYSQTEIAHQLKFAESRVKTYLSRAHKQFRILHHLMSNTDGSSDRGKKGAEAHRASQ